MKKTAQPLRKTQAATLTSAEPLPAAELLRWLECYHADCRILNHSPNTIVTRRTTLGKFHWHLQQAGHSHVDRHAVTDFFRYLHEGHL